MTAPLRARPGRRPPARLRARGQDGMTLIEIMLVVALLGLIAVPLGMVFLTVVRSNSAADERFDRSNEEQRIGEAWTRDVQSVEPGGVNGPGPNDHCGTTDQSPSYSDADELRRVSFNWDFTAQADGASTVRRTATWVVKGPDQGPYQLIRRYCEDLVPKQERVLAKDLTASGLTKAMAVRGPGNPTQDFCPADGDGVRRKCTIVVGGGYDYQLTVTRRVPDYSTATVTQYAPGAPTAISHDARNTYLNVYWTPPAMGVGQTPVTTYRLELRAGSATGAIVRTIQVAANGTGQQVNKIESLTNGTAYYVTLRAANAQGFGDPTAPYGPMTPVPTAPEPPTITAVTANPNGTVTVTWTHNANNGGSALTSWSIWAVKDGDDPAVPANLIGPTRPSPDGAATTGTVSTGLAGFARYRFIVADHNAVGEGFRSEPSDATLVYANTVFVKNSTGNDSGSCGTTTSPCKTVNHALTRVSGTNPTVALAGGETYPRFQLTSGVTVRGGFAGDFSSEVSPGVSTISDGAGSGSGMSDRSGIAVVNLSSPSTIRNLTVSRSAAGAGVTTSGIDVVGSPNLTIESVTVTGGSGADPTGVRVRTSNPVVITTSNISSGTPTGAGVSAYGVRVLSNSLAQIQGSTISAAAGAAGADATGQASGGADGNAGTAGGNYSDGSCSGGVGGAGATSGLGRGGGTGGTGGCGNNTGSPGIAGVVLANGGGGGGTGGGGSGNVFCSNASGGNPGGGATNTNGNAATGGSAGGVTLGVTDLFSPSVAGTGNAGADGHGGGGGGGGGGHSGGLCNNSDRGGGGGGGGAGGQRGQGGTGASGGGGSFGVYAVGAVTVDPATTITVSVGGSGGVGQRGGNGGKGGNGGGGGQPTNSSDAGPGGTGGGGSGGGAGSGGGGGAGGPSIAVFAPGNTATVQSGATLTLPASGATGGAGGSAGTPGAGGTGGNNGATASGTAASGTTGATGLRCRTYTTSCSP